MNRRRMLAAGAALPLAAPALLGARPLAAQDAPEAPATPFPLHRRFQVGAFEVHTLLAGTTPRPDPHAIYGVNVDDAEFARVSAENFLPTDSAQFFFQPTLVDTGAERILFDTGLDAQGLLAALSAAGLAAGDVTHVVLTHHHGDHIGGLTDAAGAPTFPDAAILTGRAEFDFWAAQGNEAFEAKVRPFAERLTFLEPGDAVASGITALEAFGHTPGHMAFTVESEGQPLLLGADTAHHYVYALAYPDWHVQFDSDPEMAAQTRRRILDMAATDRLPLVGYHLPAPGIGYVEARADGSFRWVPHSYQLLPPQA